MRLRTVIKRSARSLRSAKARTILTSLAIAVGGFTLTATLAAGTGVREYTNRLVGSNFDPTEILVGRDKEVSNTGSPNTAPKEYDESVSSLSVGGDGSTLQIKQVTTEDVAELKKLPYIETLRENYQLSARYLTREGQKRYTVSAAPYNPSQKPELKAGSLPGSGDIPTGSIILPDNYIDVLGFKDPNDALDKMVSINIQQPFSGGSPQEILKMITSGADLTALAPGNQTLSFKVAAVYKRAATSLSFGALPVLTSGADAKAIYDYTTLGTPNYGKFIYVSAKIKDGNDPQKIKQAQADLESKGYFTIGSKEIQQSITQIVNFLQILVGVFGLITVVASVFGIVNTQYISVLERTREIGLMKALGMRSRDVRRLFMIEAGWIGFLGGLIGSLVAILVGSAMNPWITEKLDLGDGNSLLIFRPLDILTLIGGLILVAMIAGFLPARKAAKLDPIEALRTE
jgi:putative ABC transport system permease protein